MPIEIKELYIKVTVNADEENETSEEGSANASPESYSQEAIDKETFLAECVEQVMEIINEKRER